MQIKRLKREDIKLYENTLKEYIEQLMVPYTKKEIKSEVKRIYTNMCKFTEDGTAIIIGALEDKKILGFIWGYKKLEEQDTIHVNYFFVNVEYRSKGLGSKLLKELENEINDCKKLELLVNNKNLRALNFYKRNGFKIKEITSEDLKLCKLKCD